VTGIHFCILEYALHTFFTFFSPPLFTSQIQHACLFLTLLYLQALPSGPKKLYRQLAPPTSPQHKHTPLLLHRPCTSTPLFRIHHHFKSSCHTLDHCTVIPLQRFISTYLMARSELSPSGAPVPPNTLNHHQATSVTSLREPRLKVITFAGIKHFIFIRVHDSVYGVTLPLHVNFQ